MKSKKANSAFLTILLIAVFSISSCANSETNTDNSITDQQSATESAIKQIAIPDSWPESLPVPVDAIPYFADEESGTVEVRFQTNQSGKDVVDAYQKLVEDSGFKVFTRATNEEDDLEIAMYYSDDWTVNVYASPVGELVSGNSGILYVSYFAS